MTQSKDGGGFFRRLAKIVSNPATQWGETEAPKAEVSRESEAARSELKEMIERKRRNDFVRKSELDLLRKLRREGLSSEQLATLGRSSGAADSDIMIEPPVKAVAARQVEDRRDRGADQRRDPQRRCQFDPPRQRRDADRTDGAEHPAGCRLGRYRRGRATKRAANPA